MTPQRITFEVRIAGTLVPNVLEVSCSAGFDQINAEATVWCTTRPSQADERQPVTIWASNSGTGTGQIFGGEITGFDWTYAPGKVGIVCGDLLARTRDDWGGDDEEYTSQDSDAIVRNVLEKNAIPSSSAHIEGGGWTLGVINPVTLKSGDDGYGSIIQPIDDLEGYRTFSLTSGTIMRLRVTGSPGGSPAMTFEKGVTILSSPRHNRTAVGIVNRVIITGVEYEGLTVGGPGVGEASTANPYVSNVSGYNTERIQSNLVEDDATALLFAQRRVADKNRRPEYVEFAVPLEPRVQPGMSIAVTHPDLEAGGTNLFCQHVAHSITASGATTTIRAIGGQLTVPANLPPVVDFTLQLFLEGQDTGSGVAPIVIGVADASQSYDPDGTIASYAWTVSATGATPAPTSGSAAVLRFTLDGTATDVTVALTITDDGGATATLSKTVTITQSNMLVEDIYLAYGDVACSSDGEQTWQTATPASGIATCLAPFAPDWGELWGTSTGHLYATFDKLASALVDLGQPHGAVACTSVWVHETDTTRLWAGFNDGQVYSGVLDVAGHTATWTHVGTIPEGPVREIRESYGALGELRATAGQGYYYSTNGGASWSLQHTFDTAWRMAAGFDTNLASGLNDAAPLYDEDGTPPTVPGGVTHIRGLAFGWRVQELYAADDSAALYIGAGPSFDLSASADTTDAITNHMIRSGNIDRVVYMAIGDGTGTNNGFQKWLPDVAAPFYIKQTGSAQGYMIAYGPAHPPVNPNAELVLLPRGASGAADKIFYYTAAAGWTSLTPPSASKYWTHLVASPLAPDHWLLFGNSNTGASYTTSGGNVVMANGSTAMLWRSDDAGQTWTACTLPSPGISPIEILNLSWSLTDPDAWYIAAQDDNTTTALWRGTSTTGASVVTDTTTNAYLILLPGLDGDVYFAPAAGGAGTKKAIYVDAGNAWHVPSGSGVGSNVSSADYVRGTRRSVMMVSTTLYTATDYRTAQPVTSGVGGGGSVAYCNGIAMLGDSNGIIHVLDPFGTPSTVQATGIGTPMNTIRSDRQTQTRAAAIQTGSTLISVYNGTTWFTLTGPADADATKLSPYLEVIVR